ncbi:MAG: hypothetical protein ACJAT2_002410 [Bacteriovoracaceae bacterium]|jgi:hypothetical protein
MRIVFNYLKLKDDFNRLEVLHWGHFAFVLLGLTFELTNGLGIMSWLISVALLSVFYKSFFTTKKELFYSFWTFSTALALFIFYKVIFSECTSFESALLYLTGLSLLGVEVYILSSPIYYPRVMWWEYDFRYRTDLKVDIFSEATEKSESRITDLRRNAGCIASFEEIKPGTIIKVESPRYFKGILEVEIISKRIYSLGRPFSYGVKFCLNNPEEVSAYNDLLNFWKNESIERRQRKFTPKITNEKV